MTTRARLATVGIALFVGLLAVIGVALWTLDEVRVNGPLYARIVQGKDLVADILPPPEYALEAHDLGLQIAREPDAGRRAELAERLRAANRDFDERHSFWKDGLEQGAIADQMEANYLAGHAFLSTLLGEVVPAHLRGEDASEALSRAEKLFEAHRQEVLKLVKLADKRGQANEAEGRDIVRSRVILLVVVALLVLAVGAVMGVVTARQVGRGIAALTRESEALGAAVARGQLDRRASLKEVPPEFAPVAQALNGTMDAFVRPVKLSTVYLARVAVGETPPLITDEYQGEFNEVKKNWNQLIEVMQLRSKDVGALLQAAREGRLDARADASRYKGEDAALVQGMNALLDAMAEPLHEMTEVLGRLAQRDLRARMKGNCAGDFARAKESMNATGAATQIASSSQAVASGASEQAASIEETNAGLESITATKGHQRDRLPDEPARAQRSGGGRARR